LILLDAYLTGKKEKEENKDEHAVVEG